MEKDFEGMMFCDYAGYCKGLSCKNYYKCRGIEKEEEKENKKTLINTRIDEKDIEKYSKIIVKKALKVIATNGSIYQEVALQLILDNYIINKNTFKVVRSYIYKNYEKTELEIFTDDTEKSDAIEKTIDNTCYISFLNNNLENTKKAKKIDLKKLYSILSDTEKKIYNYYFINNMKKIDIAKMLDIKKQNITTYILRIKQKAVQCI